MSDNSDTPTFYEHTLQYPHPRSMGHALSGVKIMGGLGREQWLSGIYVVPTGMVCVAATRY